MSPSPKLVASLLRGILDDDRPPLRSRVAACLLLLYAQPASRIVRLTTDDIVREADQVRLRLGEPPVPVPEPFATLLRQLAEQRQNMNSAANPDCSWLFPGRRAGQPLNPGTLQTEIRKLGISANAARIAALGQLVLQTPAHVIAQALGFHDVTTHRHNMAAGGTWKAYPAAHVE